MFHDVMAPETQDGVAFGTHEIVTATVIGTVCVLVSVDFDNKPSFAAGKVGKKGPMDNWRVKR